MQRFFMALALLLAFFGLSHLVHAQEIDLEAPMLVEGPQPDLAPRVLVRVPARLLTGSDYRLEAHVQGDWLMRNLRVEHRPMGSRGEWTSQALERSGERTFATTLGRDVLLAPGLEVRVLSEDPKDKPLVHLAGATILVEHSKMDQRKRERLEAHRGKRSEFRVTGDATFYGRRLYQEGDVTEAAEAGSDRFWSTEAEYTYRTLETLYDIRFGVGLLRGERARALVDDEFIGLDGQDEAPAPGLNYGWSEANFALHRLGSVGVRLTLGASEEGFVAGLRSMVRLGEISGTHLEFGGEAMQDVGNLGYMKFQWTTLERVPMAMTVEVSERPGGENNPMGTRLMLDVGWQVTDQFLIGGRAGYAARLESLEGGAVVGLHSSWSF